MNVTKTSCLGYTLRTGMDTTTHLQTRDYSKQSNVSGYAPARFGLESFVCAPKGPPAPLRPVALWSQNFHPQVVIQ